MESRANASWFLTQEENRRPLAGTATGAAPEPARPMARTGIGLGKPYMDPPGWLRQCQRREGNLLEGVPSVVPSSASREAPGSTMISIASISRRRTSIRSAQRESGITSSGAGRPCARYFPTTSACEELLPPQATVFAPAVNGAARRASARMPRRSMLHRSPTAGAWQGLPAGRVNSGHSAPTSLSRRQSSGSQSGFRCHGTRSHS
jgi:hypothetical protein